MTKRERQLKSMLNYFEIDMGGTRNEKMTKRDAENFFDKFNSIYDGYTVEELVKKIRDRQPDDIDDEKNNDPFFDSLKDETGDKDGTSGVGKNQNPFFNNFKPPFDFGSMQPPGINPEIEKFLDWMTDLLYSADHKVVISEEGNITHIKLQKIKSKRGGKKK
jgi:hypothetical protein